MQCHFFYAFAQSLFKANPKTYISPSFKQVATYKRNIINFSAFHTTLFPSNPVIYLVTYKTSSNPTTKMENPIQIPKQICNCLCIFLISTSLFVSTSKNLSSFSSNVIGPST